jgi:YD repeat-containing protein
VTSPGPRITTYDYDDLNRVVTTTNALSGQTITTYDDLGRLTRVIENYADGEYSGVPDEDVITRYVYDAAGNRTAVVNSRGYTSTYTYDTLSRLIEVRDPLNHATRYGYDAVGNRTVITDANTLAGAGGAVTLLVYDDANRLTDIDYSDSTPDVSFTYDDMGHRLSMLDGTGVTTYTYDSLYRLAATRDGAGQIVGYGYDAAGNRVRLTYPDGKAITYTYDAANRLDVVADWGGGVYDYTYDDANRLEGLSLPNGVASGYTYDDAGRLALLTHSTLTETLASYAYALDAVGNRTVLTETPWQCWTCQVRTWKPAVWPSWRRSASGRC